MNSDQKVVQVLNRLTFGAKPGDFDRVKAMGVKAYISSQLNPRSIAENPGVDAQVASAEIIHRKSADLIKEFRLKPLKTMRDARLLAIEWLAPRAIGSEKKTLRRQRRANAEAETH
jgi:hypothetical protein